MSIDKLSKKLMKYLLVFIISGLAFCAIEYLYNNIIHMETLVIGGCAVTGIYALLPSLIRDLGKLQRKDEDL